MLLGEFESCFAFKCTTGASGLIMVIETARGVWWGGDLGGVHLLRNNIRYQIQNGTIT
jgi:hypothetical protein